jgi:hypothetical protein
VAAAPASGTDDVADEEVMQRLQQAATGDVAPTGKDKPDKKQGRPTPSAAAEKQLAAAEKKQAAADKGGKAGKKAKADKERLYIAGCHCHCGVDLHRGYVLLGR